VTLRAAGRAKFVARRVCLNTRGPILSVGTSLAYRGPADSFYSGSDAHMCASRYAAVRPGGGGDCSSAMSGKRVCAGSRNRASMNRKRALLPSRWNNRGAQLHGTRDR
jgi:hypothetical protein